MTPHAAFAPIAPIKAVFASASPPLRTLAAKVTLSVMIRPANSSDKVSIGLIAHLRL